MHEFLLDMLQCPACYGPLAWKIADRKAGRILEAEATCQSCGASYPVREGIAIFLTLDLPRDDLWEQVDNRLSRFFEEHPDIEHKLMDVPLESLNPADQFFRARLLEERGDFAAAKSIAEQAFKGIYTPEYLEATERQYDAVVEQVQNTSGPVVDLASGRGYLVEKLLRQVGQHVVATDFSPSILRRNRRYFEFLGLQDGLTLVACDARRMPFKEGGIQTLTTNVGLANISEPGNVLAELNRVVGGGFWAVSMFYPRDDKANAEAIRQFNLDAFLYEDSAVAQFAALNWPVEVTNRITAKAKPTPASELLGAGIDGLPVAETDLLWCTLVARKS